MRCAATGKIRHLDRAAARHVQAQLPYRDKIEPYPCPDCGGWHLGGHHRRRRSDVRSNGSVPTGGEKSHEQR